MTNIPTDSGRRNADRLYGWPVSLAAWIILASLLVSIAATFIALASFSKSKSNAARLDTAERPPAPEPEPIAEPERWRLTWESGSAYRLTNTSAEDAREVELVTRDGGPQLVDHVRRDVAANESVTFAASIYVGMSDHQITVTWYRPDGELKAWRTDLPS